MCFESRLGVLGGPGEVLAGPSGDLWGSSGYPWGCLGVLWVPGASLKGPRGVLGGSLGDPWWCLQRENIIKHEKCRESSVVPRRLPGDLQGSWKDPLGVRGALLGSLGVLGWFRGARWRVNPTFSWENIGKKREGMQNPQ